MFSVWVQYSTDKSFRICIYRRESKTRGWSDLTIHGPKQKARVGAPTGAGTHATRRAFSFKDAFKRAQARAERPPTTQTGQFVQSQVGAHRATLSCFDYGLRSQWILTVAPANMLYPHLHGVSCYQIYRRSSELYLQ